MKKAFFLTATIAAVAVLAATTLRSVEAQAPAAETDATAAQSSDVTATTDEVAEEAEAGWIESLTGIKGFGSGECSRKSGDKKRGECNGESCPLGQDTEETETSEIDA